jgi:hypothetical protein
MIDLFDFSMEESFQQNDWIDLNVVFVIGLEIVQAFGMSFVHVQTDENDVFGSVLFDELSEEFLIESRIEFEVVFGHEGIKEIVQICDDDVSMFDFMEFKAKGCFAGAWSSTDMDDHLYMERREFMLENSEYYVNFTSTIFRYQMDFHHDIHNPEYIQI